MTTVKTCHACKKELSIGRSVGRKDACPSCGADLRCCLNCTFFDPAASKQCREPVADRVKDKSKSNFCDFFTFSEQAASSRTQTASDEARKILDDLFKK